MRIADHWSYPGGDSCADFWTACVKASGLDIPDTANVLEIGCAEFNWISHAHKSFQDMTFTGVDWRSEPFTHTRRNILRGDARNPDLFPPQSFDWIVSISAMEHMGLGHYHHSSGEPDPIDPQGDIQVFANAYRWLKVGGTFIYDVPYDPTGYRLIGTDCRVYDDDALWDRTWCEPIVKAARVERARGVADPNPVQVKWLNTFYCEVGKESELVAKPTAPVRPFHYAAVVAQRVG